MTEERAPYIADVALTHLLGDLLSEQLTLAGQSGVDVRNGVVAQ